ncbi:DUF4263 domain-containing protein [Pseudenhygromyxa sp. WMMC2535]|uniref:Shedu immune nuclease family protein n=1 Tax=Pseudenhygromyxa sp. WMMC2535 TaxID=2712867 RepID=UPI00155346C7|nr:Shedu immune nuclease family protein [Pseudenhygromyxa sp. WMMC2535]NVB41541.1 DUF4263 domain-containing protein [Pseudenhygromyxa sp. WMMC2535]
MSGKKLEQVVAGRSVATGGGKRVDALLKTLGVINSLCFVEIKRHDTALLEKREYGGRSDVYSPSRELTGAVAQIQITTQKATVQVKERFAPVGEDGVETGEILYAIAPKSLVVCGSLSEFRREGKGHPAKIRAFELYRRSLNNPEIITFDELYERARFIAVPTGVDGDRGPS